MTIAGYRQCVRCCIDTTVPGAAFDSTGVCSLCHLHDRLEQDFPIGSQGQQILEMIATRIRRAGHGKRYDCVVGISGGRDSSYTLHMIVRELGLRPLAVHFNDGFGNPIAGDLDCQFHDTALFCGIESLVFTERSADDQEFC